MLTSVLTAKEEEEHAHEGQSNIKFNYEVLNFTHSKKKKDGQRFGVELDHDSKEHHFQLYAEKTKTHTSQLMLKDLDVKKVSMKYQYKFTPTEHLTFSYMHIDDNLMKETDGGNIIGIGYSWAGLGLTQYMSDYPHFNVYQTDLKYTLKHQSIKWTILGKYIHLGNKNSNNFSKKSKNNYLTVGLKIHTHFNGYFLGASVFVGERMFAVMKEGFAVQHHAMAFNQSYMLGIGYQLNKSSVAHIRYIHHNASEVPIHNTGVKVDALTVDIVYNF
jgi:hypothetical protein